MDSKKKINKRMDKKKVWLQQIERNDQCMRQFNVKRVEKDVCLR